MAPKINHDDRGLTYACAAAYVRLNNDKIHIFYLRYMKGHEVSITFHQETWYHV